jgi:hypothetical protein
MNNTPITKGELRTLVHDNIGSIFGSNPVIQGAVAQYVFKHAEEFLLTQSLNNGVPDQRGNMDILVLCDPDGTPSKVTAGKKQFSTSHLRVLFLSEDFWKNYSSQEFNLFPTNLGKQALLCIDVSSRLLTMKNLGSANYFAYNIGFRNKALKTTMLDKKTIDRLAKGYFGITSRNIVTRFGEHLRLARNNGGSMLHSVWHSMMAYPEVLPSLSICGLADTLDQIYAIEEELVKNTLAPLGLNAIPGGWAGIKMLHTLGLTHKRKMKLITPEDRDDALTRLERLNHPHGSPCCHYRRGHLRKLSETRHTYVTGHFVNADKEIQNEEVNSDLVLA